VADRREPPPLLFDGVLTLTSLVADTLLWHTIIGIAKALRTDEWVLVGGQMVALHGFMVGVVPPRVTTDIDIVADVLVRPGMLRRCADVLESMKLEPRPSLTRKRLHRFVGTEATVDLLVPDHLPAHVNLWLHGHAAVPIAGGRRALDRSGRVVVDLAGERGEVILPDLLGALVLKSRAARTDHRDNERHISDIAFLCSLVADPLAMRDQLDAKERASLRSVPMPADTRGAPWVFLDPGVRQDASDAWLTLVKARR